MSEKTSRSLTRSEAPAEIDPFEGWTPFRELFGPGFRMPRILDELLGARGARPARWAPAVDIAEDDQKYVITAEIPGASKEDVHVDVHDNLLDDSRGEAQRARGEEATRSLDRAQLRKLQPLVHASRRRFRGSRERFLQGWRAHARAAEGRGREAEADRDQVDDTAGAFPPRASGRLRSARLAPATAGSRRAFRGSHAARGNRSRGRARRCSRRSSRVRPIRLASSGPSPWSPRWPPSAVFCGGGRSCARRATMRACSFAVIAPRASAESASRRDGKSMGMRRWKRLRLAGPDTR